MLRNNNLIKTFLSSSVLICSIVYLDTVYAATTDVNGPGIPSVSGNDIKFTTDDNIDITDGHIIGNGAGFSAQNQTTAINQGTLTFLGDSTVASTIGIGVDGALRAIIFNGLPNKTVTINGATAALDAATINSRTVIYNGTVDIGNDFNIQDASSAIFNQAVTINHDFNALTSTSIFNANANIVNDMNTALEAKVTFNKIGNIAGGNFSNQSIIHFNGGGAATGDMFLNNTATVNFNQSYQINVGKNLALDNGVTLGVAGGAVLTLAGGDLTNAANGARFVFNLSNTATPGLINVVGKATINNTQAVKVLNVNLAQYQLGTNTKNLVTETGNGVVSRPALTAPNNLFMTFTLDVPNPNTLTLVTTRVVPTELVGNNNNVVGVLGTVTNTNATGALLDLVDNIGDITDLNTLNEALGQIVPLIDGGVSTTALTTQDNTFDLFSQRLGELRAGLENYHAGYSAGHMDNKGHGTWIKFFGNHAHQSQHSDNIQGYQSTTGGIAAGFDTMVTERNLIGAALSWATVDVHHDLNNAKTDINSYQGSLYGSWNIETPLFLNWMASAAFNQYDVTRHIIIGNFNQTMIGEFDGWQYGARGELGYVLGESNFHVTPTASLTYSRVTFDAYREKGNSTANQTMAYSSVDALLAGLGIQFSYDIETAKSLITQEVHANAGYDFIGDDSKATGQFVSFGPAYQVAGGSPARWDYNLGVSITTWNESGLGFSISYDYDWKNDYHAHSGFFRLRYEW